MEKVEEEQEDDPGSVLGSTCDCQRHILVQHTCLSLLPTRQHAKHTLAHSLYRKEPVIDAHA